MKRYEGTEIGNEKIIEKSKKNQELTLKRSINWENLWQQFMSGVSRRRIQITHTMNGRESITTASRDGNSILRECNEKLYANKIKVGWNGQLLKDTAYLRRNKNIQIALHAWWMFPELCELHLILGIVFLPWPALTHLIVHVKEHKEIKYFGYLLLNWQTQGAVTRVMITKSLNTEA